MNTKCITEIAFAREILFIIVYYSSQAKSQFVKLQKLPNAVSICRLKITHETHIRTFLLRNKDSMLKRLKTPLCIFRRKLASRR